ncbi:CCR4-NOT core subunit [Saccharomycopsis crataegensis]|uniref:General negative regulator of transcription subunit n=1 Tax=Saccharomycopsis crataegensis TaxID=43959 RepID=A0AAV5QJW4_9ASCO|nr:CCR4-NOT core subunit [Saccharomycopsis crataegensis]
MMAQRKLQQEIDRVFKRVNEGLMGFDYLYDKVISCENPSQKEKLESDLKKEIKKLQRQREQIKNWISGNDVKDKKPLLEYRKKIERQMERFKLVERDMKTKAFSKEGLNMEKKLDPREREKIEATDFVSDNIEKINQQNEGLEAKIQQIQSTVKKNKKVSLSKQSQIDGFQEIMDRNNWHLAKLETILRFLENGKLEPDQISDIKESITYYVDSNQDPDFYDDDTVYDELGLDEVEPTFGPVGEFVSANADSDEEDESDDHEEIDKQKKDNIHTNELTNSVKDLSISSNITPTKKHQESPVIRASTPSNTILNSLKPAPVPKNNEVKYSTLVQQQASPQQQKMSASSCTASGSVKAVKPTTTSTPVLSYSKLVSNLAAATDSSKSIMSTPPPINAEKSQVSIKESEKFEVKDEEHQEEVIHTIDKVLATLPGLSDLVPLFEQNKNKVDLFYQQEVLGERIEPSSESFNSAAIFKYISNSLINCPDSVDSEKPFNYFASKPHPTSIDYPVFEKNIDSLNNLQEGQQKQAGIDNKNNFCLINGFNKDLFKKLSIETLFYIFYYGDDNGSNPNYYLNFQQKQTILTNPKDILLSKESPSSANATVTITGNNVSTEQENFNEPNSSLLDFNDYDNGSYIQYLALRELQARNWKFNKKLHVWFQRIDNIDSTDIKGSNIYKFFDFEVDWSIKLKEIELDFNNDEFEKW